ncbi:hypothetical protein P3T76_010504 [Phytophthora citrophthora]|uniref:Uncharacterized protein n=1 Tax=Phytophthora citrophthora TaxID=4793 RepID=A0AAD9LGM7_9STRA|nr:hypothetical protein P3T76_010504 [Phytophthora citrophthora]
MAYRRHIYRRMQKRTRQELRSQIAALNEELARLRDAKESKKALFNATQTSTLWFWKSVATRQRHERSLAEEEQRALTMSVHSQAAYIQTLTKVAGMPEKTPLALTEEDQGVIGHKEQRCGPSETKLFHAFIQHLDAKRKHVDELFQDYRSKLQFDVRKADGELEYSQLYITETIPFSLSQTSHSLWKLGIEHHSNYPDFKRCTGIPDPENTSARSFS